MSGKTEQPDLGEALQRLRQDPESMSWPQRRTLAKAATEQLAEQRASNSSLRLIFLLADDPKWEVRKDIADCLLLVPDEEFPRLAAKLSGDSNSFVRKAAERALDRRRRGQQTADRRKRGLNQVAELHAAIEKVHGGVAADKASQMAERLYDLLVGATVHDMRGILTPLKSSTESLLAHLAEGNLDQNTFRKMLTKMADRLGILERLLDDMRAYSQATPPERRRERLLDVVNEAHAMVQDVFRAKDRDASCVSAEIAVPENITLEISRYQIVVAIANVLENAYEAFATGPDSFQEGSISVEARVVEDERAEVIVRDTGMGLSEEELEDVCRFVPGGTSKKRHGTGFGLPIARRKIMDHGGTLAIESEESKGTTVTVTLPLEAEGQDS